MKSVAAFVPAGTGETFAMMGITMTLKQTAGESGDLLSVIEQAVAPGAGSPLQQCSREDKLIYVLEGEFAIRLGPKPKRPEPGAWPLFRAASPTILLTWASGRGGCWSFSRPAATSISCAT